MLASNATVHCYLVSCQRDQRDSNPSKRPCPYESRLRQNQSKRPPHHPFLLPETARDHYREYIHVRANIGRQFETKKAASAHIISAPFDPEKHSSRQVALYYGFMYST